MRRRISLLVVATTSAVVVAFVIPLCLLVQTLARDRAMAAADQEARNVAILVAGLRDDDRLGDLVDSIDARGTPTTGVLTARGRTLGSGIAGDDDPEVRRALDGEAFRVVDEDGGRVLLPVIVEDGTAVVRSQVGAADLRRGVAAAWTGIIGVGCLLLLLSVGIAWQLGRRISAPLRAVSTTAHRLREGDLGARAGIHGPPETQELARALNGLADRITELLALERASVGDLSHRLRTPVTALRLDAEAVADQDLAVRLQTHIGVLQRTIDAIVKDARRPVRTDLGAAHDARATVRERMEFWGPLAEDQDRDVHLSLPASAALVPLTSQDLTDLIDVLVDNVFAHTPEGVALHVTLAVEDDQARLTIEDEGPGIDPGGHAGASERPGRTGLGLEIAARIAQGCGGGVTIGRSSSAGGVRVDVRLPIAAP